MEENTMALTTTQKAHLTKMNRAAKDVALGTIIGNLVAGGSFTSGKTSASAAEASASALNIPTGLTAPTGYLVQGYRSGSVLSPLNVVISGSNLLVTSASPATFKMANGDTFNWVAF
jgi:hypothetical protein